MLPSILLAAAIGWLPARAEQIAATLQDVTIALDTSVWRVEPGGDKEVMVLTCIAADCTGNRFNFGGRGEKPQVYATARQAPGADARACIANDGNWRRARPLGQPADTGIRFRAVSHWSGCRALDAPILEACGEHNGRLYQFITAIISGCNRSPEMSTDRFLELIRGVAPTATTAK